MNLWMTSWIGGSCLWDDRASAPNYTPLRFVRGVRQNFEFKEESWLARSAPLQ
jgi:hypothetical protein